MPAQLCFNVSIVFSFVAWGLVTGSVIWPAEAAPKPCGRC
jgi:hypothetical protein